MSPDTVVVLIRVAATIGEDIALAIHQALLNGEIDTVADLAKVLPDAHQQQLRTEALIQAQHVKGGLPA